MHTASPVKKRWLGFIILLLALLACTRSGPNAPLRPGNHSRSLEVNALDRNYILHVPAAVHDGKSLPLLIVLHGAYGSGRRMQAALGFDDYADTRGFYVAYPDSHDPPEGPLSSRWNDGRETLKEDIQVVDDVGFILAMIEVIAAAVPLDRTQIFVTSASNGGMLTYRLGCETSGIFAGIAPMIANIPAAVASSCAPPGPIAVLAINGTVDPFMPYAGGEVCPDSGAGCEKGLVLSAAESLAVFVRVNGCSSSTQTETLPILEEDGTLVQKISHIACDVAGQTWLYAIHEGGHSWPPIPPQLAISGQATSNLDATQIIVDTFFPEP